MQAAATITNQIVELLHTLIDHTSLFERIDDLRTNIRTATNGGGGTQHFRGLFDRRGDLFFTRRLTHRNLVAFTRERTSTHERSRPGAKIFGAETTAHYFLDVLIDVPARYLHRHAVAIHVLENIESRQLHRSANHARHLFVV